MSTFRRSDSAAAGAGGGWRGAVVLVEEVLLLVQKATLFSCAISRSIIVLWITSIAGDNRQAAERAG